MRTRGRYLPLLIAVLPPSSSVSGSGQNQLSVRLLPITLCWSSVCRVYEQRRQVQGFLTGIARTPETDPSCVSVYLANLTKMTIRKEKVWVISQRSWTRNKSSRLPTVSKTQRRKRRRRRRRKKTMMMKNQTCHLAINARKTERKKGETSLAETASSVDQPCELNLKWALTLFSQNWGCFFEFCSPRQPFLLRCSMLIKNTRLQA